MSKLLDFLVSEKFLTAEQVRASLSSPNANPDTVLKSYIASGHFHEAALAQHLSKSFAIPMVELSTLDPGAIVVIPTSAMRKLQCVPYLVENKSVHVALADPTRIPEIRTAIKHPIIPAIVPFSSISGAIAAIEEALGQKTNTMPDEASVHTSAGTNSSLRVMTFNAKEPAPNVLNKILTDAIEKDASDIHIESEAKKIKVRLRIEGLLVETFHVPLELRDQLIARVKVVAGMDISERKVPQDGRFKTRIGDVDFNFRANTMPAINGESIAIRVLRPESVQLDLSKIGFTAEQLGMFKKGINQPNGLVLVTGPTGCGKTTTLYSAIAEINRGTEKITTVEDPVEFSLEGITQVQVNNETGLTFAAVLKSMLRQDPDVILIGEIRDQETATIAVQAALSGHMVLSTIHTSDAPSAILRLLNMGIEPFMVLSSVTTLVAQRLVRKICNSCRREVRVSERLLAALGDEREALSNTKFYQGSGCDVCMGLGYKGRVAIFEVLELTPPLKELLLKGENPITFKRKAIEEGMKSLRQSALELVAAGVTTLDEAIASTAEH